MIILRFVYHIFVFLIQSVLLALGQIRSNKTRSVLTTVGIVIGVASVTAVIASLAGLKAKVLTEFQGYGSNMIWVSPDRPKEGPWKNVSWEKIRLYPSEFDGVLDKCPSIEVYSLCTDHYGMSASFSDQQLDNVRLRGIGHSMFEIEKRKIVLGRPFSVIDQEQKRQVCLITKTVQQQLKLNKDCIGQLIDIQGKTFNVIGVVEEKNSVFDMGNAGKEIFIPFETAWKLWRPWMHVMLNSKAPEVTEEGLAELRFFLRTKKRVYPGDAEPFRVQSLENELEKFNKLSSAVTAIAGGVVSVSLLVGGIGIMNIMLVSVSERTREIGLRKAVGARPSAIMLQFLIEAIVLCLLGGLIGIGLGYLLTLGISKIPDAQLEKAFVPMWAIWLAFGFSAFVGIFFGFFPAFKASRLDPIAALRYE